MKIDIRQVPEEGLTLSEDFDSKALDLDTDLIKFLSPVTAKVKVSKSYRAVSALLTLNARVRITCSRCLKDQEKDLSKSVALNFAVDKSDFIIDFDPEIREEIILDYPVNPLCKSDCNGLCPKCGKNLNEGGCNCGST